MKLDLITNKADVSSKRNENDEFYTPIYAIKPLLKYLKAKSNIWCPFDSNESNYTKILSLDGHNVLNTHIDTGHNFFNYEPSFEANYIISNPPYSLKYEVFKRLFELNKPFAMLVGVVGLFESQKRFTMFKDNDFEIMYFDKRVAYFKDYADVKPKLNPPFSSVYLTKGILPNQIVFERIIKKEKNVTSK